MNKKNGKYAVATAIAIIILAFLGQSVQAQQVSARYDRASYVPGDTGTLYVTVVNNHDFALQIRNLTVYFPWAQLVDGKWPSGANSSINLSPFQTLGSQSSSNDVYTNSFSFTIPSWYGGSNSIFGGTDCPPFGSTPQRYDFYRGCILVGTNSTSSGRYSTQSFSISMAQPFYTPLSIVSDLLPIATLVVLVVATAFLALAWLSLRRTAKKA